MTKKRMGECVHCGAVGKLTRDHIPPRNLFATPPPNMLTVPSCEACNGGSSGDDEYFRMALTFRHDSGDHPQARKLAPSVVASLGRPQARGFLEALKRSRISIDVSSPGGIYLGRAPGFVADLSRLSRVAARLITGLFYHECKARLPDTHAAIAWQESGLQDVDPAILDQMRGWCARLQLQPATTIGQEVFSYWFERSPEDSFTSFWLMIFYNAVGFIGLTARRGKVPTSARRRSKK